MELMGEAATPQWPYVQPMQAPLKRYELTDHLGNVAAVVTGRLLPGNGSALRIARSGSGTDRLVRPPSALACNRSIFTPGPILLNEYGVLIARKRHDQ